MTEETRAPAVAMDPGAVEEMPGSADVQQRAPVDQRDIDLIIQTLQSARQGPSAPQMMQTQEQVNQRISPEQYEKENPVYNPMQPEAWNQANQMGQMPEVQDQPGEVKGVGIKDLGRQDSKATQKPVDPYALSKSYLGKAYKSGLEGIGDVVTQGAREEVETLGNLREKQREEKEVYGDYLADIESAEQKRDAVYSDIKAMSKQYLNGNIDPNKWWGSRTTAQKIAIGIGAFLSGFGGSDAVIKMVENAIDRDIDAQEKNFKMTEGRAKNMYALADKLYGDRLDKAKIVKLTHLELIKNKLEANMAQAKTGSARSKMKSAISALQMEIFKGVKSLEDSALKANQQVRKEQKISVERANKIGLLKTAMDNLNVMARKVKLAGKQTWTVWGDNEFTNAMKWYTQHYTRALSGAAIKDEELAQMKDLVNSIEKGSAIQKHKIEWAQQMVRKYYNIMRATTKSELDEALGGRTGKNPNFIPMKGK